MNDLKFVRADDLITCGSCGVVLYTIQEFKNHVCSTEFLSHSRREFLATRNTLSLPLSEVYSLTGFSQPIWSVEDFLENHSPGITCENKGEFLNTFLPVNEAGVKQIFMPDDGVCFYCGFYIEVKDKFKLVTGCPNCNRSFVE